ncbi:MAG: hypothetical protein ACI9HK_002713, partial [Pirellulaceae bacterium]
AKKASSIEGPFFKWRVRESHPTDKAYEASLSTGPPASKLQI